ncbi:hypothetical protein CRYUN_Cryun12cG0156500 [Craigia yunnanensis]
MFQSQQQQQQLQQSSFTYLPSLLKFYPQFSQPPTLSSQPLLFLPGTDPYAHPGQLTLTHVEFEVQAQFYVRVLRVGSLDRLIPLDMMLLRQ